MGSSSSAPSESTAIAKQSAVERQKVLQCQIKQGKKKDFYELFDLERYSNPSAEQLDRAFRQESRKYHPDKNPPESKAECNAIMSVLGLAKETLLDYNKKRRYDFELRVARKEQTMWDRFTWLAKPFFSVVSVLGGVALILAVVCGVPFAPGTVILVSIIGSTVLAAGMASGHVFWQDPSLSFPEFGWSWLVGGLQGAATGGIAAACGGAVATTGLGGAILAMSGKGALCGVAQKGILDATEMLQGTKSAAKCLTMANGFSYAKIALIGALLGAAVGPAGHSFNSACQSDHLTIDTEVPQVDVRPHTPCADDAATPFGEPSIDDAASVISGEPLDGISLLSIAPAPHGIWQSAAMLAKDAVVCAATTALDSARDMCTLAALSVVCTFSELRVEDRWLCPPTSSAARTPKYLDFMCGRLEEIQLTAMQDAASADKVLRPLCPADCLRAYTKESALYRNVNASLRLDSDMEKYGAFVWHTKAAIQREISKCGRYTGTAWRGVTLSEDQLSFYTEENGRKFLWADFVSSSSRKGVAKSFGGNALFRIDCEGDSLTDCVDIHSQSEYPQEHEVLFSPYSGFEIVAVEKEDSVDVIHLRTCETLLVEVELAGDRQGIRGEDRWLCPPAVLARRQPKYLKFARGCEHEINPTAMQGVASPGTRVQPPLLPDDCLPAYTKRTALCRDINAGLATDSKMDTYGATIWQLKAAIKAEISKSGLYHGIAWRGANLLDEQMSQYMPGRRFLWADFVSTSVSRDVAAGFGGNTLFRINCKGKGLTFCVDICSRSAFPDEQEVLFFPYSGFEVMEVSQEDSRHVIHLQTYDTILVERELARVDRWLCPPVALPGRMPKYLEFACGSMQEIHPTVVQDVVSSDQEDRSILPEDCLSVYINDTTMHHHVNAALTSDTGMEEYGAFIWQLKAAIKREISKRSGSFTGIAWRGATLSQEDLLFYVPGRKFLWADFVSTSTSRDVAVGFGGNVLLEINCKGQGVTYCVEVHSCSAFPDEQEVLFFPYSGFKVIDVNQQGLRHVIHVQTYDTILVEKKELARLKGCCALM